MILGGTNSIVGNPTFTTVDYSCTYTPIFKKLDMEGDMAYEYNPFYNLQADDGSLKAFNTDKLGFDLQHPVDITVQPSYDGTANLILNDDKNPPRLINSRFTLTENKTYKRIDRKGVNDTNIYKERYLDINTRLFKTTNKIPYVKFENLTEGGSLQVGNYSFYFKYSDADTNETDFICETGEIPVYMGNVNDPKSIRGGLANEVSNKIINIKLYNLDESYEYINIYYSKKTSDVNGLVVESAYKIKNSKKLNGSELLIAINGFESVEEISIDDINMEYNIVDKVKTQAQAQNTLFFANVDKEEIPYSELADLSLRILPSTVNDHNIGKLNHLYEPVLLDDLSNKYGYYDAKNVYDYTGYWEKEIYRFGVFYIMKNDTLSPVFDIRGRDNLSSFGSTTFTDFPMYKNNKRYMIPYDDDFFINSNNGILENAKGTVRIMHNESLLDKSGSNGVYPVGIKFHIPSALLTELSKYVKGFCFVRQKRVPTILAQGVAIGVDSGSYLPMLYAKLNTATAPTYITESFINSEREFVHDFNARVVKNTHATMNGLLCPEALFKIDSFAPLFTGSDFNVSRSKINIANTNMYFSRNELADPRHFYIENYTSFITPPTSLTKNVKMTLVEGGMSTKYSGTKYFSSKAGMAEETIRFKFIGTENKSSTATNLARGLYTGFIGIENINTSGGIYDIHTPGYSTENMKDYFIIRFNSVNPYYSISDRYDIDHLNNTLNQYDNYEKDSSYYKLTCYRGDCYISNVTMRMQRNFQDPSTPINDDVIDSKGWKTNYKGYMANGALDTDSMAKINRSDVNAIRIGHWATFMIMSNMNLCYRSNDETNSNEYALTGNPKSFYPLSTMNIRGSNKIDESYLFNAGYNTSVNNKTYNIVPDVPYINTLFSNRIMYSDISVDNSFKNGYRVFQGLDYKDLTSQYGSITKLYEFQSQLIIVFENGVGLLPVNERTLITSSSGGDVFIESPNVINKVIKVLSSNYGSVFPEGIKITANYVYGVDTDAKKIWRTDGASFEVISDFKIQKFLNDNITLSEKDKYVDLKRLNVKIHYNAFKQDLIFVFYNNIGLSTENRFAVTFNEQTNNWVSFNSWYPFFTENINNIFFSTSLDKSISIANKAAVDLTTDDRVYVYKHGQAGIFDETTIRSKIKPCYWFDTQHNFEYEFVVAEDPYMHKIFDNLVILSNNAEPDSLEIEVIGDAYEFDKTINGSEESILNGYNKVSKDIELSLTETVTDGYKTTITEDSVVNYQKCLDMDKIKSRRIGNMRYLEDVWKIELKPIKFNHMLSIKDSSDITSGMEFRRKEARIRDKYCKIKVRYKGDKLAIITALNTLYSDSYA